MADDVTLPGSGSVVATDDVGGVHYQKFKLDVGGDGASIPVSGSLPVSGDVAHDAVDSGDPVKVGAVARSSFPTAVAAGDRVNLIAGTQGQLVVTPGLAATAADNVSNELLFYTGLDGGGRLAAQALYGFDGSNWDRVRVASTGRLQVDVVTAPSAATAGDVAHDDVDSGNPVKIGARASTTVPAVVAEGDRVNVWATVRGALVLGGVGTSPTDGLSNSATVGSNTNGTSAPLHVFSSAFNGSNWDRLRGNTAGLFVQGNVANNGADSGNPVKIGGTAFGAAPAGVTEGNRVNAWFSPEGHQAVFIGQNGSGVQASVVATTADAQALFSGLTVNATTRAWNGASWDRVRGDVTNGLDVDVTRVQGSVAVTGTFWQATQPVSGTVTANAGTGTMATSLAAGPPPHNVGITPLGINFTASTTQTSVNLIAGAGGQRVYVTSLTIATGGTTAGRVSIYWGTGAFSAGTSPTLFDGEFAPSATARPGAVLHLPVPRGGESAAGDNLRITTSAAMTVYVTGAGYRA